MQDKKLLNNNFNKVAIRSFSTSRSNFKGVKNLIQHLLKNTLAKLLNWKTLLTLLVTTLASILLRYLFLKSNVDILDVVNNTYWSFSCYFSIGIFRWSVRNLLEEFFPDKLNISTGSGSGYYLILLTLKGAIRVQKVLDLGPPPSQFLFIYEINKKKIFTLCRGGELKIVYKTVTWYSE